MRCQKSGSELSRKRGFCRKSGWGALFLSFLVLICMGGCAPQATAAAPEFWREAVVTTEKTSGVLGDHSLVVQEPAELAGMECDVSGGIVSVSFGEITKTSDTTPGIRDLEPSRILLTLESLSAAHMSLVSLEEEKASYTATTALGEFSVTAGIDGRVISVKNETTGFAMELAEPENQETDDG